MRQLGQKVWSSCYYLIIVARVPSCSPRPLKPRFSLLGSGSATQVSHKSPAPVRCQSHPYFNQSEARIALSWPMRSEEAEHHTSRCREMHQWQKQFYLLQCLAGAVWAVLSAGPGDTETEILSQYQGGQKYSISFQPDNGSVILFGWCDINGNGIQETFR